MGKIAPQSVIRAKVVSFNSSRQQFKPYSHELQPVDLYVEIPVPAEGIVTVEAEGGTVITLAGFTAILNNVATALDGMHEAYVDNARRGGRPA